MIDVEKWQRQREQDIKNGSFALESVEPIEINLDDKEIIQIVNDNLLDIDISTKEDVEFLKQDIKCALYMNKITNDFKGINNFLIEKDEDYKRQFPKLFFMEELAERTKNEDNYEDAINLVGLLKDIKCFLDENPEYQGYTGEQYQESDLSEKIERLTGLTFSWRNWGSFMASYMNTKEKARLYHYMSFYM